ncbi:hypothetical protein J2046_005587 [Rhizobium petrolearium]|jgi:hypothetical protein|nr:hypothetical protein [Neorhizobium petrolearium]
MLNSRTPLLDYYPGVEAIVKRAGEWRNRRIFTVPKCAALRALGEDYGRIERFCGEEKAGGDPSGVY